MLRFPVHFQFQAIFRRFSGGKAGGGCSFPVSTPRGPLGGNEGGRGAAAAVRRRSPASEEAETPAAPFQVTRVESGIKYHTESPPWRMDGRGGCACLSGDRGEDGRASCGAAAPDASRVVSRFFVCQPSRSAGCCLGCCGGASWLRSARCAIVVGWAWRQPTPPRACCKHTCLRTSSQSGGLAEGHAGNCANMGRQTRPTYDLSVASYVGWAWRQPARP
jgi:hypothetical protein